MRNSANECVIGKISSNRAAGRTLIRPPTSLEPVIIMLDLLAYLLILYVIATSLTYFIYGTVLTILSYLVQVSWVSIVYILDRLTL